MPWIGIYLYLYLYKFSLIFLCACRKLSDSVICLRFTTLVVMTLVINAFVCTLSSHHWFNSVKLPMLTKVSMEVDSSASD